MEQRLSFGAAELGRLRLSRLGISADYGHVRHDSSDENLEEAEEPEDAEEAEEAAEESAEEPDGSRHAMFLGEINSSPCPSRSSDDSADVQRTDPLTMGPVESGEDPLSVAIREEQRQSDLLNNLSRRLPPVHIGALEPNAILKASGLEGCQHPSSCLAIVDVDPAEHELESFAPPPPPEKDAKRGWGCIVCIGTQNS